MNDFLAFIISPFPNHRFVSQLRFHAGTENTEKHRINLPDNIKNRSKTDPKERKMFICRPTASLRIDSTDDGHIVSQ